jgi:hypothetical protein
MKKLQTKLSKITAITILMLFMSSTVFAQVKQDTSARDTSNQQQTSPQEQNQWTDSKDYDKNIDYSETIDQNELPQEVNSSLEELYPAHDISEVFKGNDDSYKVKVKNDNDEAAVYYSSEGEFLRAENLSGLQQEGALPQEQSQGTREPGNQQGYQMGTGTDNQRNQEQGQRTMESQQGSADHGNQQGSQMGTGTDNQRNEQGTYTGTMGTGTDARDNRSTHSEKDQQGKTGHIRY